MEASTAGALIQDGQKLVHARHAGGPYFFCANAWGLGIENTVPSWVWRKEAVAHRVHYLDLPLLETCVFNAGYVLKYDKPEVLKQLKASYLERRLWKRSDDPEVMEQINGLWAAKGKPMPILSAPTFRQLDAKQLAGARFAFRAGRVLIADGPGVGKTSEALYAVLLNKANSRPYKTLVVCPTSVKGAWIDDAEALGGLRILTLSGNMEERVAQYDLIEKADLVICAQDAFMDDYAELAVCGFSILILDEGHSIGTRENKLTQILIGGKKIRKTFCQVVKPHSIYIMTGTPLGNKLDDLYPLLKLMDPGILSWGGFLNRYTIREEGVRWMTGPNGRYPKKFMEVVGYVNHAELKAKLSLHMIRRTKDEALPNLPKKRFRTVDVEFSASERKVYEDMKETFTAVIGDKTVQIKSKLEFLTKAQQICDSLEIVKGTGSNESSKLKEMMRWVRKIVPHKKIVIFSRSKDMTTIIARECAQWNPIHFHGEVPDKKRKALIDAFQKDPSRRIFISTIKAGGVGVTLTAGNIVILYDRWWNPGVNTQAADRCHRRTQKSPVLVLSFRVKDSFEEHIEKVWLDKQQMVQGMVGDEEIIGAMTERELAEIV